MSRPAGSERALPLPASADAIDAAWSSAALAERHPGVRVSVVEVLERHEVTNAHAVLRLAYDEAAGAPATLFAKLLPAEPGRREAIARTGMGVREALFYRDLAPALALRTPRAHAALHDGEGGFALLLEDLNASGCSVSDGPTSPSVDAAAAALEDLAQMHLRYLDPQRRAAEAGWAQGPSPASDYGSSRLRYGLDHHRDRLTPAFAEIAQLYIDQQAALHALWDGAPRTIVHGDAHVGNLFFDEGRVGFLDWGILQLNSPLRDVCYFLTMSLAVEDRRTHERDLLRHYLSVWKSGGGPPIGFDDAWTTHRLHASYLAPASCQIVTFPADESPRRRTFAQAFLERAQAAIEDLEVREALREHAGL